MAHNNSALNRFHHPKYKSGHKETTFVMKVVTCFYCHKKIYWFQPKWKTGYDMIFNLKPIKPKQADIYQKRLAVHKDNSVTFKCVSSTDLILEKHTCLKDGTGNKSNRLKAFSNGEVIKVK